MFRSSGLALIVLLLSSCVGETSGDGAEPEPIGPAAEPNVGPRPVVPGVPDPPMPNKPPVVPPAPGAAVRAPVQLRRLTTDELRQTVAVVFQAPSAEYFALPDEVNLSGIEGDVKLLPVRQELMDSLRTLAERTGAEVATKIDKLVGCDKALSRNCAEALIDKLGPRAFRRPLRVDERSRLLGVFDGAKAVGGTGDESVAAVVEAMILSPAFLFRTEFGEARSGTVRLTPFETASALSYFLTEQPPDETLFAAALGARLGKDAEIAEQALRLASSPRGRVVLRDRFAHWLGYAYLPLSSSEDPVLDDNLRASMLGEYRTFFDDLMTKGSGTVSDLLGSKKTFIDARLAKIYAVSRPAGAKDADFVPVILDRPNRSGVLTMPGFLTIHGKGAVDHRSPIPYGKFVQARLFCNVLPDPPPGAIDQLPPATVVTEVQRSEWRRKNAACASCHNMIDPPGLLFSESWKGVGRDSSPTDPASPFGTGEVTGGDVKGRFASAADFLKGLAASRTVRTCLATQLASSAVGRDWANALDRPAVLSAELTALSNLGLSQDRVADLVTAIATSPLFLERTR